MRTFHLCGIEWCGFFCKNVVENYDHVTTAVQKYVDENVTRSPMETMESRLLKAERMINLKMEVSSRMSSALVQIGRAASELRNEISQCGINQATLVGAVAGAFALVFPIAGIMGLLLHSAGCTAGMVVSKAVEVVENGRKGNRLDCVEDIVTICRMYNEQVYAMMSRNELTEDQILELREAYSVENTSLESFKRSIRGIMNDLSILHWIGKEKYPFWIDSFQRYALENTNVCHVVTQTTSGQVNKLAVVCWANNDAKTTRIVHWIDKKLEYAAIDHKRWTNEFLTLNQDVYLGGSAWLSNPLRHFTTNTDLDIPNLIEADPCPNTRQSSKKSMKLIEAEPCEELHQDEKKSNDSIQQIEVESCSELLCEVETNPENSVGQYHNRSSSQISQHSDAALNDISDTIEHKEHLKSNNATENDSENSHVVAQEKHVNAIIHQRTQKYVKVKYARYLGVVK